MRHALRRFLTNFLAFNVLAIALWWVISDGSSSWLIVEVDSPNGAVVETVGGRKVSIVGGGVRTASVILPSDFREDVIPLKIDPPDPDVRLVSARVVSRFVFESVWKSGRASGDMRRLDRTKAHFRFSLLAILAVAVLEALLGALAWFVGRAPDTRVPSTFESSSVAVAFSVLVVLIAPLQTIVANGGELNIGFGEAFVSLTFPFLLAAFALGGLLLFVRGTAGTALPAFLLGVAVYEYLELGLLAADFPALDGEVYFFLNFGRGFLDAAILIVACGGLVYASRRWSFVLPSVSAAVVLLAVASVFDARKALPPPPRTELELSIKPNAEILGDCCHSTNRNVAVYILDSVATPYAVEALRQDPDLAEALDGFVAYTNNVGMGSCTVMGVAGLATGAYLSDAMHLTSYAQSCFGSNSFVRAYADRGAEVFFAPGSFDYGLSSAKGTNGLVRGASADPLHRRMRDQQQWNLFELSRFRLMPFPAKAPVYLMTVVGWDASRTEFDERLCFPRIASAPIRPGCPLTLQFWHTLGAHPPFYVNRDGVMDGVDREIDDAILEKTCFALRQFARHAKALKARGLYDRTFIVLAADHGIERRKVPAGDIPDRAFPMLFVKPFDARGRLAYSSVPTSHAKIRPLLEAVIDGNPDHAACAAALTAPVRVYSIEDNGVVTDYRIDAKGALIEKVARARVSPEKLPAIELDREYSLYADNVDDPPPACFEWTAFFGATEPRVIPISPENPVGHANISFRVEKPDARHRLRLCVRTSGSDASVGEDGYSLRMEDAQSRRTGGLRERTAGVRVVDLPVQPDAQGVVTVRLTCYDVTELRTMTVLRD